MDLGWAKPLIDAGGWVFAAVVLGSVVWLFVKGDLVSGTVTREQKARSDALEAALRDVTPLVREIGAVQKQQGIQLDFMADFVRDTIRDRARGGR